MGTRGIYGFRKNGEDKLTYNHYDSYPEYLGANIVNFCINTSIEEMNTIFDNVVLIDEDDIVTEEQVKELEKYCGYLAGHPKDEWYNLLRNTQEDLFCYKDELKYMIDSREFIKSGAFCEYGYIINLDTCKLEFWVELKNKGERKNRYYPEGTKKGMYMCDLVAEFDLNKLNEAEVISKMMLIIE